jgi:hypothetical protein
MAPVLANVAMLTIHAVSRPYRDRPPSTLEQIYLDATPRPVADGERPRSGDHIRRPR